MDGKDHFYKTYYHLDQNVDANLHTCSPTTSYLLTCKKNHVSPRPILIKPSGTEDEIKINNLRMSDEYAEAIMNNIKFFEGKKLFDLSDNKISPKQLGTIISHLPKHIEILNLGGNLFDKSCV